MKFEPQTKEEAVALLEKSYRVGWSRIEQIVAAMFLYFLLCWVVSNIALVGLYFLVGPIIGALCSLLLTIIVFAASKGIAWDCFKLLLENIDQVPFSDKSREKLNAVINRTTFSHNKE